MVIFAFHRKLLPHDNNILDISTVIRLCITAFVLEPDLFEAIHRLFQNKPFYLNFFRTCGVTITYLLEIKILENYALEFEMPRMFSLTHFKI